MVVSAANVEELVLYDMWREHVNLWWWWYVVDRPASIDWSSKGMERVYISGSFAYWRITWDFNLVPCNDVRSLWFTPCFIKMQVDYVWADVSCFDERCRMQSVTNIVMVCLFFKFKLSSLYCLHLRYICKWRCITLLSNNIYACSWVEWWDSIQVVTFPSSDISIEICFTRLYYGVLAFFSYLI